MSEFRSLNESLMMCTFSIIVALFSVLAHLVIAFYYYCKTGTFPLREKIRNNIREFRKRPSYAKPQESGNLDDKKTDTQEEFVM